MLNWLIRTVTQSVAMLAIMVLFIVLGAKLLLKLITGDARLFPKD